MTNASSQASMVRLALLKLEVEGPTIVHTDKLHEIMSSDKKILFDLLYKEAWRPEEAAMGNSTLPTVLDKLCMVANINTRKLIELKKDEIKIKEAKIQALSELIDS